MRKTAVMCAASVKWGKWLLSQPLPVLPLPHLLTRLWVFLQSTALKGL